MGRALLGALLVLGAARPLWAQQTPAATQPALAPAATPRNVEELRQLEAQVQEVVQRVMPAVVGVVVGGQSQGTGVVVRPDGLILTAAHVTYDNGRDVLVTFPDGRRARAKSIGLDRQTDAGMIQIAQEGEFPFVEVARTLPALEQWCIALGHPAGYQKGRTPPVRLGRVLSVRGDAIITSCTLVGGDSGGPLFDLEGRVIAIHSRIGSNTSLNLHVPITAYLRDWNRMLAGEARGVPLATSGAASLGAQFRDGPDGVVVTGVVVGGPGAAAGLRPGDVIVRLDGREARTRDEVSIIVGRRMPGEVVDLQVRRGGQTVDLKLTLGGRE